MKLSIVIVNYNVEYFLEQCLLSVNKALKGIKAEVFVVDNNSVDGSLEMLSNKFPDVKRTVPFGAGATLSYNHIDLQVKNETPNTFQLKLWLDGTHLNGKLLCNSPLTTAFKVEERNHASMLIDGWFLFFCKANPNIAPVH